MQREALAIVKKLNGKEHQDVAFMLTTLAEVLRAEGKLAEAEAMHREALTMNKRFLNSEHPRVAASFVHLANVIHAQGKLAEAETLIREALAMQRKSRGNEHPGRGQLAQQPGHCAQARRQRGREPDAVSRVPGYPRKKTSRRLADIQRPEPVGQ